MRKVFVSLFALSLLVFGCSKDAVTSPTPDAVGTADVAAGTDDVVEVDVNDVDTVNMTSDVTPLD
jgi:hypothetical protein